MNHRRRHFRRLIIPLLILVPLLWIMTGCFYFPTFEYRTDTGPNIRALVGEENSHRPISLGHVTRAQVIALLGEAPYVSDDGTAIGYITHACAGAWVWPLCFAAVAGSDKAYAVRLVFDRNDVLVGYDWADAEIDLDPLEFNYADFRSEEAAMLKLNWTGIILHRRIQPGTTQPTVQPQPMPSPETK